jgi:hypothetical protein
MAVDSGYFASLDLEPLLIDRDTGQPLSNGTIRFFQDTNRNVPKLVYQLVNLGGNPPNYDFQPLPNPINLGAFGTISDNAGNNVALYYYPYDDAGAVQLYYVEVRNANGVLQFTREAWPPNVNEADNPNNAIGNIANQLSNPQFAQVSFLPNNPLTITIAGAATTTTAIAPDWDLVTVTSGASTVQIQRNSIAGTQAFPFNPPYTLTITPGANIASLKLRQRLNNNPNIWAPAIPNALNGYLASTILLAPASSVIMEYQPSGQAVQVLLTANNISGAFAQFNNTVQLLPDNNPQNSDIGFVDILLNLPVGAPTTFSNVQVVPLNTNQINIVYDQTPVNRQADQLFNYWQSLLNYKPISSYLVGWDFALNPAQVGSTFAASGAGANTSRYTWDQTIIFQSANNGPTVSRGPNQTLVIGATNNSQFAIIQYLPAATARKILNDDISATITVISQVATTLNGKISLWYTTDVALPNINANASLVATLDATGKPATFNGNWTEVFRGGSTFGNSLGDAAFTVTGNSAGGNFTPAHTYGFSGWNVAAANNIAADTATFFAIVVGFETLLATRQIAVGSISLVPGKIPTIPSPQSASAVLMDCERYYQKSFAPATVPAQAVGANTGDWQTTGYQTANPVGVYFPSIVLKTTMLAPPAVTLYNPTQANANPWNYDTGVSGGGVSINNISTKQFQVSFSGQNIYGDRWGVHWTADRRLGVP